nr:hypothetical protein [Tanacetum cinerariifolium]
MEPKKPVQALKDPIWVEAMQDEPLQFKLLKVWTLVDLPKDKWAIGTKWVFRNKKDERGIVVKNKARLVAQGHTQEEDFDFLDKVYKVEKALHGLHQAPRACQDKYVADILKKFNLSTVKTVSTPMEPNKALVKDVEDEDVLKRLAKLGLWYPRDLPFDLEAYSDSDYAGASLDRKSTTGGCQFLGKRTTKWKVTKISQSSGPTNLVAVETVYKEWEDRIERATTTASSLKAEQDSDNINKTNLWQHLMSFFLRELV